MLDREEKCINELSAHKERGLKDEMRKHMHEQPVLQSEQSM